ncbi:MAG TPA: tetratricopeptide repeat protein [Nitrospirota bacterium]|nr:tetratricopeptide repeat protein [Nitrospirota bacterium]
MSQTIKKLLSKGLSLHRSGDFVQAERSYRTVLSQDPGQSDALYLLGMIALQRADNVRAVELISKALERHRTTPEYHANLAIALHSLGRHEESVVHCREALAFRPDQFSVLNTLGNALMALEQREEALECLQRAVKLKPDSLEINYNLANALRVIGRSEEAAERYGVVINLKPDHVEAIYNLANLQRKLSQHANARDSYLSVLALKPDHADAMCGLADMLHKYEEYEKAETYYRSALSLKPDTALAYNGLGNTLRLLGKLDEALDCYRRALEVQPQAVAYYCNISNVLFDRGQLDEAVESCERALTIRPDFPEAHWNMGPALVAKGDLDRGWQKYEYRLSIKDAQTTSFTYPDWDGSSLQGKTLLVYTEQGVGDEIMFASCLPDVINEAGRCIVECDARLAPLFKRAFPRIYTIQRGKGADHYPKELPLPNCKVAMGSLPRFYRSSLKSFPHQHHYLTADPAAVAHWKDRFNSLGSGLKIGISWRGGKIAVVRRTRSTSLDQWKDLLLMRDACFINLQYGDCKNEIQDIHTKLGVTIHDWDDSDPLTNLDDFAAKISALDLVISVDNSTVHLAGALGVPVWTLLTFGSDWRWMRDVEDTPWYHSMRLLRQPVAGDWGAVFSRVTAGLTQAHANRKVVMTVERSFRNRSGYQNRSCGRVGLLNDTTYWYHWGCTGTSRGILRAIAERGYVVNKIPITGIDQCTHTPQNIRDFDDPEFFRAFSKANSWMMRELRDADIVVVNGEGSLHGINSYTLKLLYLIYASKMHLKKQVQIINHSCYPDDSLEVVDPAAWKLYKKVYNAIDFAAIREPLSHELLTRNGVSAELSFDCLPLYIKKTYDRSGVQSDGSIVIAGSVILNDCLPSFAKFLRIMHGKGHVIKVLIGANLRPARDDKLFVQGLTEACPDAWSRVRAESLDAWLDTIAQASVLVSGRFHHTIAASMLGTPCILLGSNTPKNAALAQVVGIDPPLSWADPALAEILVTRTEDALKRPDQFRTTNDTRDRMCQLAERNFIGLEKFKRGYDIREAR